MSLISKIKKLFTRNSEDDLFVPNEYSSPRPRVKKPEYKETEYVNELLVEETFENSTSEQRDEQRDERKTPCYRTSYRINVDTGVQEKLYYKYIVYLTSVDINNNNKEYNSYCIIQGSEIHGVPKYMQLIALEREIYAICNRHSNTIDEALSSEFRLQLINELRKILLI